MNKFESVTKPVTKPLRWFMALLLVALAAGCGGGGGGGDPILGGGGGGAPAGPPAGATTPGVVCPGGAGPVGTPTVTVSNPTSGNQFVTTSTTGVAGGGKQITATFSEPMNPATIISPLTTFTLTVKSTGLAVPGAVVTMNSPTNTIATLTTPSALLPNTEYTAIITTFAKDAAGNALACAYAWTFKTAVVAGASPSISLGLASSFAIASTAGVTNVGATTINGDVVLHPNFTCNAEPIPADGTFSNGVPGTQCAGFAPTLIGTVISPLYPDAGVTSLAVQNALRQTFIDISPANLSAGVITITGPTMGDLTGVFTVNKSLFYPGIYKTTAGGMTITNDLTLDAQGNADAVFVFQSDSTIGTAAGAAPPALPRTRILLVNGAKASNVWWWSGTAATTLGAYTEFQGNVLSYDSVTLVTGATSCGRLFAGASTAGAFVFGQNIVSVPGQPFVPPAGYSATCQ